MEAIVEYVKELLPMLAGAGFAAGLMVGVVPVVLSYAIRKVQDLVDING